jgi:uncharacterized protein DUF3592
MARPWRSPVTEAGRSGKRGLPGKIFGSLFFLPFLGLGLCFTGLMIYGFFRSARTLLWDETRCTIVRSEVEEHPDAADSSEAYRFKVAYIYTIGGQRYTSDRYRHGYSGSSQIAEARKLADHYPVGSPATCYVNPDQPSSAMLRRPNLWSVLFLPFPLLFVAVGGGGLYALWKPDGVRNLIENGVEGFTRRLGPRGCLTAFFAVFFLAGAGFSLFFLGPAVKVLKAKSWPAMSCTILSSQVRTHSSDDGGPTFSVDVLYTYSYGGREYRSDRYQFLGGSSGGYQAKERIVRRLPPLTRTPCYVNPDEPAEAVLNRDFSAEYAFGLVPLLFMLVGLGGMVFALRGGLA